MCLCVCSVGAVIDKRHPTPHSSQYSSSHTPVKTEATLCSQSWLGADSSSVTDTKKNTQPHLTVFVFYTQEEDVRGES